MWFRFTEGKRKIEDNTNTSYKHKTFSKQLTFDRANAHEDLEADN